MNFSLTFSFFFLFFASFSSLTSSKRAPNPALYTGYNCTTDKNCFGTHNFCNEVGQCECDFMSYPKTYTEKDKKLTLCETYKCAVDKQCSDLYGPNTKCGVFNVNICDCKTSFKYSKDDRECETTAKKLKSTCSKTAECGSGTACTVSQAATGKCECLAGDIAVNDYGCDQYYCKGDADCQKVTPNSTCVMVIPTAVEGTCMCRGIFQPNTWGTGCSRRGADRGGACKNILDCGLGATCADDKCLCAQGWVPSSKNSIDCEQIKCRSDSDCSSVDKNSYCDIARNQCLCSSRSYVDSKTQKCVTIGVYDAMPTIIMVIAGAMICAGLVILGIRFYLANKRATEGYSGKY